MKKRKDIVALVDELRQIAYEGINFSESSYDRERYERLSKIVTLLYSRIADIDRVKVNHLFRKELGAITIKVGVDAAIIESRNRVLLHRRSDDKRWGLPGGWVIPGETVEEAVTREVCEETGLEVRPTTLVGVFSRSASSPRDPHGSCHLLYICDVDSGHLRMSHESLQVEFRDPWKPHRWHRDHRQRAQLAVEAWLQQKKQR